MNFGYVVASKFFELFAICQKGISGHFCGKRDIEDLDDDVSFFMLFIFPQVGIAYGTFFEQADNRIVVDTLWPCFSHASVLSP